MLVLVIQMTCFRLLIHDILKIIHLMLHQNQHQLWLDLQPLLFFLGKYVLSTLICFMLEQKSSIGA